MSEEVDPKEIRNWMRIALILTNYNMPERTDAIVEYLTENVEWPMDFYVVDNASDLVPPSKYTKVFLEENRQTCGGWLAGIRAAREAGQFEVEHIYWAYLVMITSAEFVPGSGDPITPMAEFLLENKEAVIIHPALTEDSTTTWTHMLTTGGIEPRRTFMVDNICALYRADWFNGIGWFDPELTFAWGADLEACYKARRDDFSIWIDERTRVKKVTDIGYTMDRMNMTREERFKLAADEGARVLGLKYGPGFLDVLRYAYTEDEWLGLYPRRLEQ